MTSYILTNKQKDSIQGKTFAPYKFFNCVPDINNVWYLFLSSEDKAEISSGEYSWILELTEGEYVPPVPTLEN